MELVADYDEYNAEMSASFVGHGYRIELILLRWRE